MIAVFYNIHCHKYIIMKTKNIHIVFRSSLPLMSGLLIPTILWESHIFLSRTMFLLSLSVDKKHHGNGTKQHLI